MNKFRSYLTVLALLVFTAGSAQQINWLDVDGFDIDAASSLMTNTEVSSSAYALSASVIPQGGSGYFEITNFYVNENPVNHPTVESGIVYLYLTPSSVTAYDVNDIVASSYAVKIGFIFQEGGLIPWKAKLYGPGNVLLGESVDIFPNVNMKLRIDKTPSAITLTYDGVEVPNIDISHVVNSFVDTDFRVTVFSSQEGLSLNYNSNGFVGGGNSGNGTPPTSEDEMNWIVGRTYEADGDYISAGITYFNCIGSPTQSQSKDILTQRMWSNQVLYDSKARSTLRSYRAPLDGLPENFVFKNDFIQATNGNPLSTTTLEANPEVPPVLGTNVGTLGWYYSEQNTVEPLQDITTRPYARMVYDELNPGNVRMISGGKYIDTDGNGTNDTFPQGYSYTMPATQELYYVFGQDYFDGPITSSGKEVVLKSLKTVYIDPHGNETVTFSDLEGRILGAARTGGTTLFEVVSTIGDQKYVDVHIPKGITNGDVTFIGGVSGYTIWDLRTGLTVSTSQVTGGNVYRVAHDLHGDSTLHITAAGSIDNSAGAKGIRYSVNYYDFSLNYYDKSGRLLNTVQPLGFDSAAYDLSLGTPNHTMISTYEINAIGEVLNSSQPDEGNSQYVYRSDGQIRFSKSLEQDSNGEFSYTNYDSRGRPVESGVCEDEIPYFTATGTIVPTINSESSLLVTSGTVTKIGVTSWENSGFASVETTGTGNFSIPFQFTMNTEGVVGVSVTDTNGSYTTIEYGMYFDNNEIGILNNGSSLARSLATYDNDDIFTIERTNSLLQFTQNGQVLYQVMGIIDTSDYLIDGTLYDQGAVVSNLEIQTLGGQQSTLPPVEDWVVDPANCREQIFTVYDVDDHEGLNAIGFSTDPNQNGSRVQRFIAGNVSKTYTKEPETNTTWYSYDVYGRVEWMIQYINGLGATTIDYKYNEVNGNIDKVIYQRTSTNELFVHRYSYDGLGRLIRVETSTDNQNFLEHAKYYYYETGQIKRVELAEGMQGTDYVYTLDGMLKAINHPSLSNQYDPGDDQNDAFGMILEYHEQDYIRTGGAINYTSAGTNRYDGNLKGVRWRLEDINPPGNFISGYLYEYNKNNWLTSATYGNFSNNVFTPNVQGDYNVPYIDYDANGNITGLFRNMNTVNGNNSMDELSYFYNAGTNGLNYVQDASYNPAGNTGDITTQQPDNYIYNDIGQLVENKQDDITYEYYANGLVKSINSTIPGSSEGVEFFYNDRNHRVEKRTTTSSGIVPQTFYVRDASGRVLAIYNLPNVPGSKIVHETIEYPIFGYSRLGVYGAGGYMYELTDHLGNVRAVIQRGGGNNTIVSEDFSGGSVPAGWTTDNTTLSVINEQLKAVVTPGVSNHVAVGFSVTSGREYSVSFEVDLDETPNSLFYVVNNGGLLMEEALIVQNNGAYSLNYTAPQTGTAYLYVGLETEHGASQNNYYLDNVIVKDVTTDTPPIMLAYKDYYPFGMPMPDRNIEGNYRYAYQGQEKDSETGMEAFELRIWDARIGRWLTTDPYNQYFSPYLGMGNNPINGTDPDGGLFGRIRAWLYKLRNGGEIFKNDFDQWMWASGAERMGGNMDDGYTINIGEARNFGYGGLGKLVEFDVQDFDVTAKSSFGLVNYSRDIGPVGAKFKVLTMDLFSYNAGFTRTGPNEWDTYANLDYAGKDGNFSGHLAAIDIETGAFDFKGKYGWQLNDGEFNISAEDNLIVGVGAPMVELRGAHMSKHGFSFRGGLFEDFGGSFSLIPGSDPKDNPFLAIAGKLAIRTQLSFRWEW